MNTFDFSAFIRSNLPAASALLSAISLLACNADPAPKTLAVASTATIEELSQGSTGPATFADLTNDVLFPPTEPALTIAAETGELILSWSEREHTSEVAVYRYDTRKGTEHKLDVSINPATNQLRIPSLTHLSAWHRIQYRVELCSLHDCVSSQRVAITGLAGQTTARLSPSVFLKNERYAEDFALNDSATLAAITLPLEGSIELQIRTGTPWLVTQRHRLSDLATSPTRRIYLDLSGNGDVLAVLIIDSSTDPTAQLRIIERLGEAWIETQQLPVVAESDAVMRASKNSRLRKDLSSSDNVGLILSSDGDRLLLHLQDAIFIYHRDTTGWSHARPLDEIIPFVNKLRNDLPIEPSRRFLTTTPLLAVSASSSLDRIVTLHARDEQLWLIRWDEHTDEKTVFWQPGAPRLISGLDVSDDIHLKSNAHGDKIAIAGWEGTATGARTPVMWRFDLTLGNVNDVNNGLTLLPDSLMITDSLRLAPTSHSAASLRFASDDSLSIVAFGWQVEANVDTGMLEDASLMTYTYDSSLGRWLNALELPEAIPTLAKQSFAQKVVIAADGSTMLLSAPTYRSAGLIPRIGEVLVLR